MTMNKTEGVTDTQRLADMKREDTDAGEYARVITDACPKLSARTVLQLVDAVTDLVAERQFDGSCGVTVHAVGTHIPARTITYPNGAVSVDHNGHLTEVSVNGRVEVE